MNENYSLSTTIDEFYDTSDDTKETVEDVKIKIEKFFNCQLNAEDADQYDIPSEIKSWEIIALEDVNNDMFNQQSEYTNAVYTKLDQLSKWLENKIFTETI